MPRALLRAILVAVVTLACALVGALWRAFRGSSRRARKAAVLIAVAMVLLVVVYAVARKQLSKGYRPSRDLEAVAAFVEDNRERIELFATQLEAVRALIEKDDWIPEGEQTHKGTGQPSIVLWAHHLRGGEDPGLGGSPYELSLPELSRLEQMASWARDPASIAETYDGQSVDKLANALDLTDAPYLVIGEIGEVVEPKVDDLKFAQGGGIPGKFTAGRATFRVGVVELKTGALVAYGGDEATNSESVRITGAPDVLMSDLRWQTHVAALKLGNRLLGGGN